MNEPLTKITSVKEWDPKVNYLDKGVIEARIKSCISFRSWQHVIELINSRGLSIQGLKVAEIGCGTGVFSLTMALLGARVTLIDYNQKVLEQARKIFEHYDCEADFVLADCLKKPEPKMQNNFDLVFSGGLAEHFLGENRAQCLNFHKQLLKQEGIIHIEVPNKLSPFYQLIRIFRKVTGTWKISLEEAFSKKELENYARKLELKQYYVLGNSNLLRDLLVYSRGLISAIIDVFPEEIKKSMRNFKKNKTFKQESNIKIHDILMRKINIINSKVAGKKTNLFTDNFSAGLLLFALKS